MKIEGISRKNVLIRKVKNFFKAKPKKLTLFEIITKLNKENHFEKFDENLINEIYTDLIKYGVPKVQKKSEYEYSITLYSKSSESIIARFEITENGIKHEYLNK